EIRFHINREWVTTTTTRLPSTTTNSPDTDRATLRSNRIRPRAATTRSSHRKSSTSKRPLSNLAAVEASVQLCWQVCAAAAAWKRAATTAAAVAAIDQSILPYPALFVS
ncbi:hypothetical protein PFISCL1PPCAC_22687, partial [Pristionchus fissidentatus]